MSILNYNSESAYGSWTTINELEILEYVELLLQIN